MELTLTRQPTHPPDTPERLIVNDRQPVSADISAIFDAFFTRVYNYIRYRVQDARVADDLTAVVFEKVVMHLASYQPERAPLETWLFAIVRHVVVDYLRAQRRRRWLPIDLLRHHPDQTPAPENTLINRETTDELLRTVAGLPDRERELIALRFGATMTNRQIAALTGLTESNVGVILHRALRKLRRQLEPDTYHD